MKTSNAGLEFVTEEEGFVATRYLDQTKHPTIGVGHLLTETEISSGKIKIGKVTVSYRFGLTKAQVLSLLAQDVRRIEDAVNELVEVELNQNQFDVLIDFTFNVGTGALERSTLLQLLNEGDYAAVPNELRKWVKSDGVTLKGLVVRRERECDLWNTPVTELIPAPMPDAPAPVSVPTPTPPAVGSTPIFEIIMGFISRVFSRLPRY